MTLYFRKISILVIILKSFAIFISCETKSYNQANTLPQNQQSNIGNISETEQPITSILNNEGKNFRDEKIIEVGLMFPLSGQHYLIGKSLLNAAQLALEKTGQTNIIFHVIDTGNEENLLSNLYRLLKKDIDVFIGPIFTNNVIKVHEIIEEKNIPIITLSNNSKLEKRGVYVFGLTLKDEIETLLNYSTSKKLYSYAVIAPKNEFGIRVKEETEIFREKNNLSSFKYIFYDTQSPDFYSISKNVSNYEKRKVDLENKIKDLERDDSDQSKKKLNALKKMDTYGELDFDSLLIFTQNFKELSNLSSILPYYDVDPKKIQYMGNSLWGQNLSLKEPGLDNSFFTSLNLENKNNFKKEYFQIFKTQPHSIATLVYDIIGLISKLHSDEKIFRIENLYTDSGFIGMSGWFKINENGKVLRNPNIYKIKNQSFILLN